MSRDRPVRRLRLDGLAVGGNQNRCHKAEGAVALGEDIGLDVAVVVFASPDETAGRFKGLGDHVVDETVFVPDAFGVELGFVVPARRLVSYNTKA